MHRIAAFLVAGLLMVHPGHTASQDEPKSKPHSEPEPLTLKVKVGARPTNTPYNVAGFQLKDPLELTGKAAEPEALREVLLKGIDNILKEQGEKGTWSFKGNKPKFGPEANKGSRSNFERTAAESVNDVVLTSLACMALRRHIELNPEKIGPAIEKGLRHVMKNAPKHGKAQYGPWTWGFSLLFLCEEYRHTQDKDLQAEIREAAKGIIKRLLQNQHKGSVEPRKPAETPREGAPAKKDEIDLPSNGGYLNILPSEEDDPEPGVRIEHVESDGPAAKAGMKDGDRIVGIDNDTIGDLNDLYERIDSLKPGQAIEVKILRGKGEKEEDKQDRPEQKQDRPPRSGKRDRPVLPEDGGWSYYQMGAMSFTTATCVMALMDAQSIGVDVPQEAIDRGIAFIDAMRMRREGSDEESYAYRIGKSPYKFSSHTAPESSLDVPDDFPRGRRADVRGTVGRIAACELALVRAGKRTNGHLLRALEIFVKRRGELDKVRGYPGNHVLRSFYNAAYYYLYGHFYSAMAVKVLPEAAQRKKIGAYIQEALLKIRHEDGTWTDHEAWGKLYGTSMAMMALGELKELAPSLYTPAVNKEETK